MVGCCTSKHKDRYFPMNAAPQYSYWQCCGLLQRLEEKDDSVFSSSHSSLEQKLLVRSGAKPSRSGRNHIGAMETW